MYRHLKVPIADITKHNEDYIDDPNILDDFALKQACCMGTYPTGGRRPKFQKGRIMLPIAKNGKLEYKEVHFKVTEADCHSIDGDAVHAGYNKKYGGPPTGKCDAFAKAFCENAVALNPERLRHYRKGGKGFTVTNPETGEKWNPGSGNFCSCALGSTGPAGIPGPECADMYCSKHGDTKAYQSTGFTKKCSYNICKQEVICQNCNTQGGDINFNDIDMEMQCGTQKKKKAAEELRKKQAELQAKEKAAREAKAAADRARAEANKAEADRKKSAAKLAAEKKAREEAAAREAAERKLRQERAAAAAAAAKAAAAREEVKRAATAAEKRRKEAAAAKALEEAKIAEMKKRIAEKKLRDLNKKKKMTMYGVILLILIILIIAIVMLM